MSNTKANKVDDLALNLELAKHIGGGDTAKVHVYKSDYGMRVQVYARNTNQWRVVNYRNPNLAERMRRALGLSVKRDGESFIATVPGTRVKVAANDRLVAIAKAALKLKRPSLNVLWPNAAA